MILWACWMFILVMLHGEIDTGERSNTPTSRESAQMDIPEPDLDQG